MPLFKAKRKKEQWQQIQTLVTTIIEEENQNLTPAQKELLRWHFRLGHIAFGWLQQLARKTTLGLSSRIAKCDQPLCTACQYGKAK